LYVAGICTSFLLERSAELPHQHSVDDVAQFAGFGSFAVAGALLVAKRPTNVIGWIMAVVALMMAIFRAGGPTPPTRWQPEVSPTL
jgi:hypothetical protein